MDYNLLFILVEGGDDKRFFENIVNPLLKKKYVSIKSYEYSNKIKKNDWLISFIKSINSMHAEYIFTRDFDDESCITRKKEKIKKKLKIIDENQIIIVKIEIESWYLAGLDEKSSKKIGIRKKITDTNTLSKENFNQLIPKNMTRLEFMQRILEEYNIDIAKEKNQSFEYFIRKYIDIL